MALIGFLSFTTIICLVDRGYFMSSILIIVIAYLLWMWFDTYYVITEYSLVYKSALLKGSIKISSIHEIVKNKSQYSGVKVTLSNKGGLIIRYNSWDDIYIAPKNPELFISKLKEINPNIEVKG